MVWGSSCFKWAKLIKNLSTTQSYRICVKEQELIAAQLGLYPVVCSTVPCSAQNDDYKVQLSKFHHSDPLVIIFCTEYHSNICSLQLILSFEKFNCLENNLSTYLRKTVCIYALRFELLQHYFAHLGMLGGKMFSRAKKIHRKLTQRCWMVSPVQFFYLDELLPTEIFRVQFVRCVLEKLFQKLLMLQVGLVSTGLRGGGVLMSDLLCVEHNVDITTCSWHKNEPWPLL